MDGEQIDHGKLRNALAALESNLCALGKDAVAKDEILKRAVSCGVVQAFEVAYEVARNFIAKRLSELWNREEVRKISKKDLFNRAEEFGIIPDAGCWYKFHVHKNNSSHNYDGPLLNSGTEIAHKFLAEGRRLLEYLTHDCSFK